MFFKLVGFLVAVAVVVCLVGFNLENRSDVSLVFHVFKNVPVFMTILCSFCCGMIFSLPFVLSAHFGKSRKAHKERTPKTPSVHGRKAARAEAQNIDVPAQTDTQINAQNGASPYTRKLKMPKKKHESKEVTSESPIPIPAESPDTDSIHQ